MTTRAELLKTPLEYLEREVVAMEMMLSALQDDLVMAPDARRLSEMGAEIDITFMAMRDALARKAALNKSANARNKHMEVKEHGHDGGAAGAS